MHTAARIGWTIAAAAVVAAGVAAYALYLEPRPPDTTAARVFAEDPLAVDYCDLPDLDGSGPGADDVPKAYTPDCEMDRWSAPVLAHCTEPLPPEADDLRGLWQAVEGRVGHVERIEQCGNRVVISGRRFIHDFRTTGGLADGANDINPGSCTRVRAAVHWNDARTLIFRAWDLLDVVSRRLEDQDTLIWEYPNQPTSRLKRICRLPAAPA
ncbi:MAG: hypothetical protein RIB46_09480 [Pseudomonadales bacterium]